MAALFLSSSVLFTPVWAGPGAHGPNGEHLDAPAAAPSAGSDGAPPRMEAHSEVFELVATLGPEGLDVFLDRFDSNAPVLGAAVELELDGQHAPATFQPEAGLYRVSAPAVLERLSRPGAHALVFTVLVGDESDLLEGRWTTPAPERRGPVSRGPWLGLGVGAVLLILVLMLGRVVRRSRAGDAGAAGPAGKAAMQEGDDVSR